MFAVAHLNKKIFVGTKLDINIDRRNLLTFCLDSFPERFEICSRLEIGCKCTAWKGRISYKFG